MTRDDGSLPRLRRANIAGAGAGAGEIGDSDDAGDTTSDGIVVNAQLRRQRKVQMARNALHVSRGRQGGQQPQKIASAIASQPGSSTRAESRGKRLTDGGWWEDGR